MRGSASTFGPLHRRMNDDKWPLPNQEELIERTTGGKIFSSLKLFTGYWNIRVRADLQEITAFQNQPGQAA